MPELPEVETIRRVIGPQIQGHTIREVLIRRPEIVEGDTQQPVGAEQHPQGHKEQQRRHSGPLGEAAGQNTGHQHRPA